MTMRRVCVALALLVVVIAATGCGQAAPSDSAPAPRVEVRVSGAGPCLTMLEHLAAAYPKRSGLKFTFLPGMHSGGAVEGVVNGQLEIGATARELTAAEKARRIDCTPLATDAVVVAVHQGVGVTDLTGAQVRDVYSGKITDWQQLGGLRAPIVAIDRNEDESAKIAMRAGVLGTTVVTPNAVTLPLESSVADALEKTPGAIGYLSFGQLIASDIDADIVRVDGVRPDVESIASGRYPATRPFAVVTPRDVPAAVADFVAWCASPQGAAVMAEHGYAPVTATAVSQ